MDVVPFSTIGGHGPTIEIERKRESSELVQHSADRGSAHWTIGAAGSVWAWLGYKAHPIPIGWVGGHIFLAHDDYYLPRRLLGEGV